MKARVMYIECKANGLDGPERIGRVTFSQTGRSVYYRGRCFQRINGGGFKSNYFEAETGEQYWISGCKKAGGDRLYGGLIDIDDDVREEYWMSIRQQPSQRDTRVINCRGKYG